MFVSVLGWFWLLLAPFDWICIILGGLGMVLASCGLFCMVLDGYRGLGWFHILKITNKRTN